MLIIEGLYEDGVRFLGVAAIKSSFLTVWKHFAPTRVCIPRELQLGGEVSSDHRTDNQKQFFMPVLPGSWYKPQCKDVSQKAVGGGDA